MFPVQQEPDLVEAYRIWEATTEAERESYRVLARRVSPSLAACPPESWMLTQRCLRLIAEDLGRQ